MGKFLIGVTGGFSSGKSTVSDLLALKGAYKIDADKISHEILINDSFVQDKLVSIFGKDILSSGKIDRRKLGNMVFNDTKALNLLCKIIHPMILEKIKLEVLKADESIIVIDAPLLIESGLHKNVDYIVVVSTEKELQVKRAKNRGYDKNTVEKIISNQFSMSEKIKKADFVLKNDKNIDKLKEGVDKLWQILEKEKKKN